MSLSLGLFPLDFPWKDFLLTKRSKVTLPITKLPSINVTEQDEKLPQLYNLRNCGIWTSLEGVIICLPKFPTRGGVVRRPRVNAWLNIDFCSSYHKKYELTGSINFYQDPSSYTFDQSSDFPKFLFF